MAEGAAPSYEVIYLGGPSSSGKTTLAKAIQEGFDDPFLHIGIDKLIGLMPAKLNNWIGGVAPEGFSWKTSVDQEGHTIREIQTGPFAQRICQSLIDVVVTLVGGNHFVIIDDVPVKQRHVDEWKLALQDFHVLYVGMSAPVDILEQREKRRENRILGSARSQFHSSSMDYGYDVVLDTARQPLSEQIDVIRARVYGKKGSFMPFMSG